MRLHILGIPHTQTRPEFSHCAFTMKAYNLCAMMHRRGHEVLFYGVAGSRPECSHNYETVAKATWDAIYGKRTAHEFYNYDQGDACYQEFNRRTNEALKMNVRPWQDIVCAPWGWGHQPAVVDVPTYVVESGIGYPATFTNFRVFESYAWMHMFWGREQKFGGDTWYDTVIPNYFDPAMFAFRADKDDYFLYMGRLNPDKGIGIAVEITREIGAKLVICGQGDPTPFTTGNPHVTYHEPVGVEGRRELMSHAKALFAPSRYVEPWGGVVVEAQASGTPVIVTDWGGFTENVVHGVTGYRCRKYEQFLWAAQHIDDIDPRACRDFAFENYRMDRVAPMYEEYLQAVLDLPRAGWYERHPERQHLDAYRKYYPPAPLPREDNPLPESKQESEWEKAQRWEAEWWGDKDNERWHWERVKQDSYARLMALPPNLDMGEKSIVDLGAGPTSMLLRTTTTGLMAAVDPLPVADWIKERYAKEGIGFHNEPAETWRGGHFDEAWIYNVLQHVQDPRQVLETAKESADTVRIFEWLVGTSEGHLHALTEQLFRDAFASDQWDIEFLNTGSMWTPNGILSATYLAMVAHRKVT